MMFNSPEAKQLATFLQSIPDRDWPTAKRWVARAWDGDDVVAAHLALLLRGEMEIESWSDDGPRVRLTPFGLFMKTAEFDCMPHSPSMEM
jgi:hypothetical protein